MWNQVGQETGGRLVVSVHPQNNRIAGSDPGALDMLQKGELEFFTLMGGILGRVVPAAELFAAAVPVRASFVDASGAPRGEGATGLSGSVPPRGPVCVKKGESLHLVLDRAEAGPRPIAHVVIFAAP